jgi:hypothetical protein
MQPLTKTPARYLHPGDVTGSGETVRTVSAGVRTPRGKVEVILEKDGRRRMAVWGRVNADWCSEASISATSLQLFAVSALLGECQSLLTSSALNPSQRASLRCLIAHAEAAFSHPQKEEEREHRA